MKNSIALVLLMFLSLHISCAQQDENEANTPKKVTYTPQLVVEGISIPWGMAFLPDGSMLITEKSGEIIHFKDGQKSVVENGPTVYNRGQGGLLDIAIDPDYQNNGWIYISYASEEGEEKGGNTAIMRAKLNGNSLTEKEVLYKAGPNTTRGQHFGSRIAFDKDGYLYFSIGDRGDRDVNPQDITRDGGKVYRIHRDGSIPSDNPFVDKEGAKTAVFSYGHRNPQGMVQHPETGAIWTNEHGPMGGDEINIVGKGNNYGWPVITYGVNYSGTPITDETQRKGMEDPLYYWVPSIAPSGMAFVSSDKYPEWKGSLLVGSLKFQYLERLELKDNKVVYREKIMPDMGRVRDVRQAPDGYIYVAVEGKGIYKLVPKE
ncbi:PQQ-dependent sugar dehydrogenase [Arenibacter amylolyticus]|uniref:PQQ-dependent sugar dehydrogenase n=1 Tax=Arenibacter amylolyticus TaxID=1406873 RepID=UPI000A3BBF48|nr:PQQ-dependent sugar dehydrogenase [Arenibacter amylolyticus]